MIGLGSRRSRQVGQRRFGDPVRPIAAAREPHRVDRRRRPSLRAAPPAAPRPARRNDRRTGSIAGGSPARSRRAPPRCAATASAASRFKRAARRDHRNPHASAFPLRRAAHAIVQLRPPPAKGTAMNKRSGFGMQLLVCWRVPPSPPSAAAPDYDVLIRGGTIYDGSGGRRSSATSRIRGDRIAYVGPHAPGRAARSRRDRQGRLARLHQHAELGERES